MQIALKKEKSSGTEQKKKKIARVFPMSVTQSKLYAFALASAT